MFFTCAIEPRMYSSTGGSMHSRTLVSSSTRCGFGAISLLAEQQG